MDADRDLLFGVLAFQAGAIDADQLAKTCADVEGGRSGGEGVAATLAAGGALTDDQRSELDRLVGRRLAEFGGDAAAALAATVDGRSLDVLRSAAPRRAPAAAAPEDATVGEAWPAGRVLISSREEGREPDAGGDPRYTRTHLHAKGGMGQVWKARDAALGREIALKELKPESVGDAVVWSRFLYEAKVTARLEHPGVVPVYEMGGGESPYYTMRFVKGRTLGEAARAYHKAREAGEAEDVDLVRLLTAFASVCHAIDYAHARGIIHRDLKGQNVVLGDYGEVVVLDWGLAKQVGEDALAGDADGRPIEAPADPDLATVEGDAGDLETLGLDGGPAVASPTDPEATVAGGATLAAPAADRADPAVPPAAGLAAEASRAGTGAGSGSGGRRESGAGPDGTLQGQLLGTPAYMAPEQARGRHDLIDFRTDVYGLGAILYEILAGQPPFLGKKTAEILYKVVNDAPEPPRSHNPGVAPGLQAICLKALAKERADRYASAGELAADVQRHLADEPVSAYAEPWTRRAARWARKHRSTVAAAAALLVVSTIASGVGTVVVNRWRSVAVAQGALARGTVNDMYARVGESWLEDRLDPLQREFLEKAVGFYEGQTADLGGPPAVRLEHAEMLRRMGNIYAKFGRRDEAEAAYRKALGLALPLAAADPEASRILASTRTRLAESLFLRDRFDEADALYREAEAGLRPLADAAGARPDDLRLLARTLRGQGQLLRRKGDLAAAAPAYAGARDLLERALAADPASPEVRGELARSLDLLGRLGREAGDAAAAEASARRAYELLDKLVAEYPTIPRYRENLHHACSELGRFAYDEGRVEEAAILWGRDWREASRLADDYPDRPEYTLNLAAASSNYGGVLVDLARYAEAQPILKKAIELDEGLAARSPDDRQVRFDLAKSRANLGYLHLKRSRFDEAVAEIEKARDLNATLVAELPDVPRYAHLQSIYLTRLGEALDASGRPGSGPSYRGALELLEKLTTEHPDNAGYALDLARCLAALGNQELAAGRAEEAGKHFEAEVARLDALAAKARPSAEALRETSIALSNLGSVRQALGAGDAEGPIRRAVAISEGLAGGGSATPRDVESLAVARGSLAEALRARKADGDAAPLFEQSVAGLSGLVEKSPADSRLRYYLGYMLAQQAAARPDAELAAARAGLDASAAHLRQAVELTAGRNPAYRELLAGALEALADVELKQAAYEDARKAAMEIPRAGVQPAPGCLVAAKLLARMAAQAHADAGLAPADRDELEAKARTGAALLLREAIDADPSLDAKVKEDPAFRDLLQRSEVKLLLGSLAGAEGRKLP